MSSASISATSSPGGGGSRRSNRLAAPDDRGPTSSRSCPRGTEEAARPVRHRDPAAYSSRTPAVAALPSGVRASWRVCGVIQVSACEGHSSPYLR
jgi:hypothetical protein